MGLYVNDVCFAFHGRHFAKWNHIIPSNQHIAFIYIYIFFFWGGGTYDFSLRILFKDLKSWVLRDIAICNTINLKKKAYVQFNSVRLLNVSPYKHEKMHTITFVYNVDICINKHIYIYVNI